MSIILGKKLKELRTEKGLLQIDVAKAIGVSKTTICHWEIGRQEPCTEDIKKICIFFNVSADYLLDLEDESGRKIYKINNNIHHNRVVNINQK